MHIEPKILRRAARLIVAALAAAGIACAADSGPSSAAGLRAKHAQLREQLESNSFGRELFLASREADNTQYGDVYGVLYYPFAQVQAGLSQARSWCDVLLLPFNTKHCYANPGDAADHLAVRVGRKAEQPAEQAYPIDFNYRIASHAPDFLRVILNSDKGPLGTRDYRITLDATPLDDTRTFIHLGYSYGFNAMSRLAMQAYLSTLGASKVGFSVTGHDSQGRPEYVGGMLGATERNTMRYFLAIDSYLGSLSAPAGSRIGKRLSDWFAATEKYPLQLHEMDRAEYLAMKQKEAQRSTAAM